MTGDDYSRALEMLSDPENSSMGVSLLRKLAEDGDTRAMCDYGRLFNTPGAPVTQNGEEAFKWYLHAAEYGDDRGQFFVGESYYKGTIVARDYAEACKWFTLSAEKGYAIAQYYLGHMYLHGNGVPIDEKEGMRWFNLSVDRECNEARMTLGDIYSKKGDFDSYEMAFGLYKAAMEDGCNLAYYKLGMMYYTGRGRPINLQTALRYFRRGSDMKNRECHFMVGKMYYQGEGILRDAGIGFRYMSIAADMGSEEAREFIAKIEHTKKSAKWGSGDNLIAVEQLTTPDLLSRPPKESALNRSVAEDGSDPKGLIQRLFGRR